MPRSILYFSSVHFQYDSRIVYRICTSLAKKYRVTLIIPNADASVSADFQVISIPFFRKLWQRLLMVHPILLWKSLWIKADVVCFADPELIPVAFIFKLLGKKIIFDVHENTHKQLQTKSFNNALLFQEAFRWFDTQARQYFHLMLAETSYLQEYNNLRYPPLLLLNYPSLAFFEKLKNDSSGQMNGDTQMGSDGRVLKPADGVSQNPVSEENLPPPEENSPMLFYIGQISYARCIEQKIEATAALLPVFPAFSMDLFGNSEFDLFDLNSLHDIPAYSLVQKHLRFHGKTDPRIAFRYAKNAFAGIALLKPTADFMESYPTKLFEYMASGLPVITSQFPLYQAIVETHQCGICIDPTNTHALVEAVTWLIKNPEEAQKMGQNGKRAVNEYFNWELQEEALITFVA